jgi:hypothetical protein
VRRGDSEMKRLAFLAVPVLLLLLLAVAVTAEIPDEAGLPAEAKIRLDQYIAYTLSTDTLTVKWAEQARFPWNFDGGMGASVFGSGVHFQTDHGPSGSLPLPEFPSKLWCVLLEQERSTGGSGQAPFDSLVFVGLYTSLYEADWIVHDGSLGPSAPGFAETLSLLGCEPGPEELRE